MPVVTMSSKGQVVIPRQIRDRLRLGEGVRVEVVLKGGAVLLRPLRPQAAGWQRWRGAFAGRGLLKALLKEHAAEIAESA